MIPRGKAKQGGHAQNSGEAARTRNIPWRDFPKARRVRAKKEGTARSAIPSKKWRQPTLPLVCSTIGAGGLNFSVRNGKRWDPAAIAARISSIFDIRWKETSCNTRRNARKASRAISTARLWRRRLYTCCLSTSYSPTTLKGDLILRLASRLDAFSAYPFPT